MDETKEILLAIKHSVEMMDAKITRIEHDITGLKADVSDLKKGQLRQERLLETLCLRSLEQENIVRDLQLNQP
ncbi:hypothetical protein B1A99_21795 [Cohnella sp. CIP 111063]|jgi:hypothetical protein|uniref:hypothetical protein n=1 Tax=unclassified Cohnella TaxID=2636738 RepID=UPI000B8BE8C0|nr:MULTISPECIES: hypothetical protein [unclassified Cohnella]OXS55863.1 hypothetical protein B1A99_21795 [Cohnella sp. CIP 111063]PRX67063.1 hypothetical protein B0G52_11573 [Cohnella sp. SGD-V74]